MSELGPWIAVALILAWMAAKVPAWRRVCVWCSRPVCFGSLWEFLGDRKRGTSARCPQCAAAHRSRRDRF